jgi:hypothetical protein
MPRNLKQKSWWQKIIIGFWIVFGLSFLIWNFFYMLPREGGEKGEKSRNAKLQMQKIESALKMYFTIYGKYPDSLQDLIDSKQGEVPFLDTGLQGITDPWGQPFSFSVVTDEFGSPRILVTSQGDGEPLTWPDVRIEAKKP